MGAELNSLSPATFPLTSRRVCSGRTFPPLKIDLAEEPTARRWFTRLNVRPSAAGLRARSVACYDGRVASFRHGGCAFWHLLAGFYHQQRAGQPTNNLRHIGGSAARNHPVLFASDQLPSAASRDLTSRPGFASGNGLPASTAAFSTMVMLFELHSP